MFIYTTLFYESKPINGTINLFAANLCIFVMDKSRLPYFICTFLISQVLQVPLINRNHEDANRSGPGHGTFHGQWPND